MIKCGQNGWFKESGCDIVRFLVSSHYANRCQCSRTRPSIAEMRKLVPSHSNALYSYITVIETPGATGS